MQSQTGDPSLPSDLVFAHGFAQPQGGEPVQVPMYDMPGAAPTPVYSGSNVPVTAGYQYSGKPVAMMETGVNKSEEKVNLSPVYGVLGLITILALVVVVIAAVNNGALTGLIANGIKVEDTHDAHTMPKLDAIDGNVSQMSGSMGNLAAKSDMASLDKKMNELMAKFEGTTTEVETFATKRPPAGNGNVCTNKKPKSGFDNFACAEDSVNEQAAADVSSPFIGTKVTAAEPIVTSYWQAGLCPVNVHWHLGAEHRSKGQYDENGKGPAKTHDWEGKPRQGLRCNKYNDKDEKFTKPYDFKHCKHMQVGETYEVHWPHSAAGACGTVNQYQTPFYDGVFCTDNVLTSTNKQIGVQAQTFTIVNDEAYYYPDLIKGMIIDGDKGDDVVFYTGSTTGDSRSNSLCSAYSPITWQVDRTCHLVSASTFDKMCADMKAQRDDMTDDLHPHGAREVVAAALTANNMRAGSLSGGRANIP